jgi:hypothetical protein
MKFFERVSPDARHIKTGGMRKTRLAEKTSQKTSIRGVSFIGKHFQSAQAQRCLSNVNMPDHAGAEMAQEGFIDRSGENLIGMSGERIGSKTRCGAHPNSPVPAGWDASRRGVSVKSVEAISKKFFRPIRQRRASLGVEASSQVFGIRAYVPQGDFLLGA